LSQEKKEEGGRENAAPKPTTTTRKKEEERGGKGTLPGLFSGGTVVLRTALGERRKRVISLRGTRCEKVITSSRGRREKGMILWEEFRPMGTWGKKKEGEEKDILFLWKEKRKASFPLRSVEEVFLRGKRRGDIYRRRGRKSASYEERRKGILAQHRCAARTRKRKWLPATMKEKKKEGFLGGEGAARRDGYHRGKKRERWTKAATLVAGTGRGKKDRR